MKKIKSLVTLSTLALLTNIVYLNKAGAAMTFDSLIFGGTCSNYECWIGKVWDWSMTIMIPLSVLVLSVAGILYMLSEGDSNKVALAKRLVIGVVSGVSLLILAKFILIIIGTGDSWNV
jgi:hypothetical protein